MRCHIARRASCSDVSAVCRQLATFRRNLKNVSISTILSGHYFLDCLHISRHSGQWNSFVYLGRAKNVKHNVMYTGTGECMCATSMDGWTDGTGIIQGGTKK